MGRSRYDDYLSRVAGQLISTLVRYPEVGTVKYEPRQQTIRFGLLLNGELEEAEWREFHETLVEMLGVYHSLEQRPAKLTDVTRDSYGALTSIAITRDLPSFTPEEVFTILEFVRERLADRLVTEAMEYLGEDDLIAQDEMIEMILADLDQGSKERNLIAIREDGRVMVFSK